MKHEKKGKISTKQAKALKAQGRKTTKAARKALLNVGAKDPGGIYQRLAVRKGHNTLLDQDVWQLFPKHWTGDALLLLLVEARALADADSYVNMGLLWRVFGINTKLVCGLLKKYPEHAPIYDDIKCGVCARLLQGGLEGTYDWHVTRFTLECNFGMRPPEAELATQSIEIKMSAGAEKVMAETERLDALNADPRGRAAPDVN